MFSFTDYDKLESMSTSFRRGRGLLKGCVGAIDGLARKIQEPSSKDEPNPYAYYNRKRFFALNIQVLCVHRLRFSCDSVVTPGCSYDSMAF